MLSGGAKTLGHYIENIGDTHRISLEMFRSDNFMDLLLSEWVSNTSNIPHLGISKETLAAIPKEKPLITSV